MPYPMQILGFVPRRDLEFWNGTIRANVRFYALFMSSDSVLGCVGQSVLGLLGLPLRMSASISIATNERTFQNRRYGLERDVASRARIGVDPQFQTRRYVNVTVNGLYE
jgi:hypothetical protein